MLVLSFMYWSVVDLDALLYTVYTWVSTKTRNGTEWTEQMEQSFFVAKTKVGPGSIYM